MLNRDVTPFVPSQGSVGASGDLMPSAYIARVLVGIGEAEFQGRRMPALEALKAPSEVELYTDSNYLRGGITSWIRSWKRNGWRTADKKPVKNADLWERLEKATERHKVRWHWVRGHAGHDENERADQLARDGVAMARLKQ